MLRSLLANEIPRLIILILRKNIPDRFTQDPWVDGVESPYPDEYHF
jgi:hypothetical protein